MANRASLGAKEDAKVHEREENGDGGGEGGEEGEKGRGSGGRRRKGKEWREDRLMDF